MSSPLRGELRALEPASASPSQVPRCLGTARSDPSLLTVHTESQPFLSSSRPPSLDHVAQMCLLITTLGRPSLVATIKRSLHLSRFYTTKNSSSSLVLLHALSPSAVGILDAWNNFHEMIPQGATLPYKKTSRFENAHDYVASMKLSIAAKPICRTPTVLADIELHDIARAKQGEAKVDITLTLRPDLTGTVEARDPVTNGLMERVYNMPRTKNLLP